MTKLQTDYNDIIDEDHKKPLSERLFGHPREEYRKRIFIDSRGIDQMLATDLDNRQKADFEKIEKMELDIKRIFNDNFSHLNLIQWKPELIKLNCTRDNEPICNF